MPSIYNYLNHREFLRDYFVEQKQRALPLTHRAVLRKMGMSSTGFLSNVIAAKKNLVEQQVAKLSRILNLARRERQYFARMVSYTQAKTLEDKKASLDVLLAMRNQQLSVLGETQFDLFSKWYYVFIRDALVFVDFRDDYEKLAAMLEPAIKPEEAKQAIGILSQLGLIAPDNEGFYRPIDRFVTTGDEVRSVQLANFQLTAMDLAKRALEKTAAHDRDISFVSMTLSPQSFAAAKSEIQNFRKKMLLIAKEEPEPDRVFQCNVQFFPVTRATKGKNE